VNPEFADTERAACGRCNRELRPDEHGRQGCRLCQGRTDDDLAVLPELYAGLNDGVTPSYGGSIRLIGGGHGRPHSPVPLNVTVLALIDDVPATLAAWVDDWASHGHADPTSAGVVNAVGTLRFNLEWGAREHPAFADFAHEVFRLRRSCERANGVTAERTIKVACRCGTVIGVTVSTPGANCPGCQTRYQREEVLGLPLAARAA
jgi:hypothetical protein